MSNNFERFVRQENIKNFKKKLETETDPLRRKSIEDLLARELELERADNIKEKKETK